MDDEDEYDNAFSDIEIDDNVVAILEEAERTYAATQQAHPPPPPKKQKLSHREPSADDLSQVPIVLGLDNDYFTRENAAPVPRRDAPRPPPPHAAKPNAASSSGQAAGTRPGHVAAQAPPSRSSFRPAPVQQPPPPSAVRRVSGPAPDAHQQAGSSAQPQHRNINQGSAAGSISSNSAASAVGRPYAQHKPPSVGRPGMYAPANQRQQQQQTVHGQQSRQSPVPTPSRGAAASSTSRFDTPNRSTFAVPGPQQRTPDIHRQNTLKRQHSDNGINAAHPPPPSQGRSAEAKLKLEMSILRAQMDEMKAREEELEKKLKDAEDAKFAKDGEVSILRASLAKSAQDHARQVALLNAAKEAAEAGKLQLHKDHQAEIEALKTQYAFRQHEMETSSRRPPWSARSKKIHNRLPPTPVKMPSQMRAWQLSGDGLEGSSNIAQTPRKPRFGEVFTPELPRSRKVGAAENGKKPALPGFFNSFADPGTPTKPIARRAQDKGKARLRESMVADDDGRAFFAPQAPLSPPSSPLGPVPMEVENDRVEEIPPLPEPTQDMPEAPMVGLVIAEEEDVQMEEEPMQAQHEEPLNEIEPPNWRDELHRLLFVHTVPGQNLPTLQSLLNSPVPSSASPELQQTYTSACATIIEHFGIHAAADDWEAYLRVFSTTLSTMARVLAEVAALTQLSALFDLLCILGYTIPSFTAALMLPPSDADPPSIINSVCHVVRTHLKPHAGPGVDERVALAHSTISLLEALAWNAPEPLVSHLSTVIRGHGILGILTAQKQPTELLTHAVRALALLATHSSLFHHLLSYPYTEDGQEQIAVQDVSQLPHIQTLCYYLVDSTRDGGENDELRDNIIVLLSTLALSHHDSLIILLKCRTLIPSIIIYLSNVATPLWEDDEALLSSPERISRVIGRTLRTIALLYHLVFTPHPAFDLHFKLHRPPARHLMSAIHVFTVLMSRISFAGVPDGLSDAQSVQLEQAVGMAKLLLGHVVDGPELDLIWSGFNPDDAGIGEDDEENEARLLQLGDGDAE